MNPKYSILVPAYNVENYVKIAITSIYKSNFRNFEIIVVDDGSTDRTGRILKDLANIHSEMKVITQSNKGLLKARREAVRYAKGEFLLFLDSDDFFVDSFLDILDFFICKNEADLYFFNFYNLYNGKKCISNYFNDLEEGYIKKDKILEMFSTSVKFNNMRFKCVKREFVYSNIDFDSFEKCNSSEDVVQTISIVNNCKTYFYIKTPLYFYRQNRNSITYNNFYKQAFNFCNNTCKIYDLLYFSTKERNTYNLFYKDFFLYMSNKTLSVLYAAYGAFRSYEKFAFFHNFLSKFEFVVETLNNSNNYKISFFRIKLPFTLFVHKKYILLVSYFKLFTFLKKIKWFFSLSK